MQDAMRRYNEAKNKANELQEELEHLTGSFKKIGSRIEQLENTVGYYSGKDKLIG
jgi:predicted  nucleic acid-binding Zn-ribbon protein